MKTESILSIFDIVEKQIEIKHPSWSNPITITVHCQKDDNKNTIVNLTVKQLRETLNDIQRYYDFFEDEGFEVIKIK